MSENVFPSVRILAKDAHTIEVKLPDEESVTFPTIPKELHGQEIPGFVLDWIIDTDEVALMVQELLQAPTRSLCRIYPVPIGPPGSTDPNRPNVKRPFFRPQINRPPASRPKVQPFRADEGGLEQIAGLPEGIKLPASLLDTVEMAKRVDAWLEQGRRVREWLEDQGIESVSWLPDSDEDK